ncbi:hypothetical protein K2173_024152 [Erythroxylum novogranatense]|uniref:Uncharacterized protein n=1 Tax=Erythroxylum novogranatense TaxID=1862640 RepID=A0AAV8UFM4_9ROSI|nr:hypothetical protein K2173_024152 [Erythroxylum novogranatense]
MDSSEERVVVVIMVGGSTKAGDSNARIMGKKGSWFSTIKRVFLPHSKDKLANGNV